MKKIKITQKDIQRFYNFLPKNREENLCWNWEGGKAKKSKRGRFWVNGNTESAYVVSYIIHVGDISENVFICHHCDNPSCVNPKHLYAGSNSENMKDFFRRQGRKMCGESAPASKVSNDQVGEIRFMYSCDVSQRKIARIYGITQSNVSRIVNMKTFK